MSQFIKILLFVFLSSALLSQNCNDLLVPDSIYKPNEQKKVPGKVMTTNLKNGGKVQLVSLGSKYVLKITPNEKLGFVESGPLEIKSGSKSFFVKNATLYDIKEQNAYFLIDVMINYIGTLKDDGITSVVFNTKFESKMQKEDTGNIKKMSRCFYELHKK